MIFMLERTIAMSGRRDRVGIGIGTLLRVYLPVNRIFAENQETYDLILGMGLLFNEDTSNLILGEGVIPKNYWTVREDKNLWIE